MLSEGLGNMREKPPLLEPFKSMADNHHRAGRVGRALGKVDISGDAIPGGIEQFEGCRHGEMVQKKREPRNTSPQASDFLVGFNGLMSRGSGCSAAW